MSLFTKSSNNGVKVYRALLTQTGAIAPVATTLENTLGATITWTYSSTGNFYATASSNIFQQNKLFTSASADVYNGDASFGQFGYVSPNQVYLSTQRLESRASVTGMVAKYSPIGEGFMSVEILVYP